MIVGVGHHPRFVLDAVRLLGHPNLYVYPEFYDNLRKITAYPAGRFDYARELWLRRRDVVIATWPDGHYLPNLPDDVVYVFPLHKREEVGFVLGKLDNRYEYFLGFPNRDSFRDYGVTWFKDFAMRYGIKTWLLGLKPRYWRYLWMFDGCDVTTMSLKSVRYADMKKREFLNIYLNFIRKLLEGRIPRPLMR